MKRIGMIGGFSPESTKDYYSKIIELYRKYKKDDYPEIVINSMDINKLFTYINNGELGELTNWLLSGINDLKNAGSDFCFISANTPHIVFDKLQERSILPMISIVETTCEYASQKKYKKLGLLGTKFTMDADFFKRPFTNKNIEVFVPNNDEIEYIKNKYLTEIEIGKYSDQTKKRFIDIIQKMKIKYGLDGMILGCTEFPLLLNGIDLGIEMMNTTNIHIEKIVEYSLE